MINGDFQKSHQSEILIDFVFEFYAFWAQAPIDRKLLSSFLIHKIFGKFNTRAQELDHTSGGLSLFSYTT